MAQDYEYDIFISYRRRGHAFTWVTEYFYPLLTNWFLDHTPPVVVYYKSTDLARELAYYYPK
ncbi:MAG: hypothetical protein H0U76_04400 [Ktedonobacteraceae bacterium]|nr:hypothetical protein [Ktedonobacteraceae bacterium]